MNIHLNTEQKDSEVYATYEKYISRAYPAFLKKLGINNIASRAEGATIVDSNQKEYIDCIGGYGLFNLGHNHPVIIQALIDQLSEKQLCTKPLITEISTQLAKRLAEIGPGDLTCSFLCNSGSEAIDSAIKLARISGRKKKIISAYKSFHGYTFGALSVSGIPSFKRHFEPLLPDIIHVPFGDITALKKSIDDDTAAILLEPIQHEAGIFLPPEGYFQEIREICDQNTILCILDEIKTGLGKTGSMFACEHFKVTPDILVTGKSLGGGLIPIGALLAKETLWKKFSLSFPMSASSYAGNVLACRAALTTISLLTQTDVIEQCALKGAYLRKRLQGIADRFPDVVHSINGLGLLIGIKTVHPTKGFALSVDLISRGVLAVQAFADPSTIMIEPPMIISNDQIQTVITTIETCCERLVTAEHHHSTAQAVGI